MIAMLVIIAAAVMVLPELPQGTPRVAGWVAVIVITAATVRVLKPTRRRRGRR